MSWLRNLIISLWLLPALPDASAAAYEVSAARQEAQTLDASQFKDFANEWAFIASPPLLGPTRVVEPWRPWAQTSFNVRSVRLAPGSDDRPVSPPQYAWVAEPRLARQPEPNIFVPAIEAGIGLPGNFQAGLLYGRSPNVNLQVTGVDISYPFLRPSLSSPGLWTRLSYVYPTRVPGLRLHVPSIGLYLTNEFLRTPAAGRPLTMHLHAGIQQSLVIAVPQGLVEKKVDADGTVRYLERSTNVFPASTQFLLGIQLDRHRWSLHADAGYASSESTLDGTRRVRAFWNQSYRLAYHWQ
jgi:hypothetical protein